ncbi:MAG: MG2 domain-containing protein [Microscillaceae bacterium]|nr:MG2 domain-containing protein [Microscillaceae bacterium]MDW8460403.1 MG2 domain-containing protein [Cytophagales bacterium]
MQKKLGLVWSIFWVYLFSTCSSNRVVISDTNFEKQVSQQQNLTFRFNQAIVPDSVVNKQTWDTTQYLQFSPKVAGKFKWISPREVIFSPIEGFAPSTDYKVTINKQKVRNADDKATIQFHTPYLNIISTDALWTSDGKGSSQLLVRLNFNYKVNASYLKSLLKMKLGQTDFQTFRIANEDITQNVNVFAEENPTALLEGKDLTIYIDKGLPCAESNYTTSEVLVQKIRLPHKNHLAIIEASTEVLETRTQIAVKTNQAISLSELRQAISLSPALPFEIETTEVGFLVKANFILGNTYQLTLKKGTEGVLGGKLSENYYTNVTFDDVKPAISFVAKKAIYLTNKGSKNVAVQIANVPKVTIEVYKIYENNLLHFIKDKRYEFDATNYFGYGYEDYADKIYQQTIETKTLSGTKYAKLLNIDFDDIDRKFNRGIYVVRIMSANDQYIKTQKIISVSDIGLMAKYGEDEIFVVANSIITAKPLPNVQIRLISKSNQTIDKATTNAEGVAIFKNIKAKYAQEIPMIIASTETDFNYLHILQTETDRSEFEVGGMIDKPAGQAYIYAERTLYRPGEKINYNVIVRDNAWKPQANVPIKIRISAPNGREIKYFKATTDAQGAYMGEFQTAQNALTGTYRIAVHTSTDIFLEDLTLQVEEFMPDRIKAKISLVEPNYQDELLREVNVGDSVRVKIQVANLFGTPAQNRNYRVSFQLQRAVFKPKTYKDFNFTVYTKNNTPSDEYNFEQYSKVLSRTEREGNTNEKGLANEGFFIPQELANTGLLEGMVDATIFDETGRSIRRNKNFIVYTQKIFLGMQPIESYVGTNLPISIQLIALDTQEKPTTAPARIKILRHRWQTVLERNKHTNEMNYVSKRTSTIVQEQETVLTAGVNTIQFTPLQSGSYEVRVQLPESEAYISSEFYAYNAGITDNNAFQVNKNGKVDIRFDKGKYNIGETAQILFTTPFEGRMLVTIERNGVLEYKFLDTKQKAAAYTLPIKESYLPNVYVTATLIKPLSDGAIPLTVAHGFAPVVVQKPSTQISLNIEAAEKSESRQTQTIKVKTNRAESDIHVTIAVADEGILQIKNYQSPNPHNYFYQKRGLNVRSYDLYPHLFPEMSVGGDGGNFEARAGQAVNKRVKLVSFWSGLLKTNTAGEVSYTFTIPQFSGSLRIIAVAYKNEAFGAAHKNMIIADPLVISTGLPRFLSPNDKVTVPVTISNTTETDLTTQVQLVTTPQIKVLSDSQKNFNIRRNNETQAEFEIIAQNVIDSAKIVVKATAMGRTFSEEIDIHIRPITGLLKQADSGELKAGNSTSFSFKQGWLPNYTKTRLLVSSSPLVEFANQLESLINYPHGCTEQVTSTVFPQLYVKNLMQHFNKSNKNTELVIAENVQEGIRQILARQNYSGGFSYWLGDYNVHPWVSVYATHFLLEAQKAGFEVETQAIERALNYLKEDLLKNEMQTIFFYDEQGIKRSKKIMNKTTLYALYVLTLGKRRELASLNYFKENINDLATDSRYLLAACFKLLGDATQYQAILPQGIESERTVNDLGGNFYSYIRDNALILNTLIETDAQNPYIPTLARGLSQQIKNATFLNTQESTFALMALGKLAQQNANNNLTASIKADGVEIAQFTGKDLKITQNLVGKNISITANGTGSLYYSWLIEGLNTSGSFEPKDRFMQVRKAFFDKDGNPIKNLTFKQNDLVVVRVSVVATPPAVLENVVLTDMLPAGFEIENPRLTGSYDLPWLQAATNQEWELPENPLIPTTPKTSTNKQMAAIPQHLDIRDDRMNFYTKAEGTVQHYFYMVRAVSKGTFQMGPASGDTMYSGDYYSYNGAGTIRIVGKTENWSN